MYVREKKLCAHLNGLLSGRVLISIRPFASFTLLRGVRRVSPTTGLFRTRLCDLFVWPLYIV